MKTLGLQITLALVLALVLIGCEQHAAEQEGPEYQEIVGNEEVIDQERVDPTSQPAAANKPMALGLAAPLDIATLQDRAEPALQYAVRQRMA